ncbi:MAG: hypothetical protein IJR45_07125 [Firmicutes bacterium]|nr:hypothetical protein [Bacillota bacterium]
MFSGLSALFEEFSGSGVSAFALVFSAFSETVDADLEDLPLLEELPPEEEPPLLCVVVSVVVSVVY